MPFGPVNLKVLFSHGIPDVIPGLAEYSILTAFLPIGTPGAIIKFAGSEFVLAAAEILLIYSFPTLSQIVIASLLAFLSVASLPAIGKDPK